MPIDQDLLKQYNQNMQQAWKDLAVQAKAMSQEAAKMRQDIESWNKTRWSVWEPYKLKWPKRINNRWYWRGDTVYRRERMRGLTGSGDYQFGDEFDILKEQYDDV